MRYAYARFPDGEKIKARQAIIPERMDDHPNAWICPHCKDWLGEGKPHGDYIQRGFEWDHVRTFMQCQTCGGFYFSDYDVWHTKPSRKRKNA
jgi:hypothetical protein